MSEQLRIHPKYHEAIRKAQLTQRQHQVLELYLQHHSIRTISRAHGVTETTTRNHLDAAIRKLKPHITKDAT
jgi:DNA-binding CsgD family transcriptional regulator